MQDFWPLQMRRLAPEPTIVSHADFLQANSYSSLPSPSKKRSKSGTGSAPSASQPRIEMFMKQAQNAVAPSSSRPAAGSERSQAIGAAAVRDYAEAISDDDEPMVAVGDAGAASRARDKALAILSPLPVRQKTFDLPALRAISSSAEAAAPGQVLAGSKRSSAAAESMYHAQQGAANRKDLAIDAARVSAAVKVCEDQGPVDVLEIDDLDSLFAL